MKFRFHASQNPCPVNRPLILVPLLWGLLVGSYPGEGASHENKKNPARTLASHSSMKWDPPEPPYYYRYKLSTLFGMGILQGSSLTLGQKLEFAPIAPVPFYLGPDITFSHFSGGHVLSFQLGGTYELGLAGDSQLHLGLGALGGVSFVKGLEGLASTAYSLFLESYIAQELDDLVSIRGNFRPGVIGGIFSFLMSLNITFRFF